MVSIFSCRLIVAIFFLISMPIFASEQLQIQYLLRKAQMQDKNKLKTLYKRVATIPGGLVRTEEEITDEYIYKILSNGVNRGIALVVEHNGALIGSMIKYHLEPKIFSHVLAEGSIIVDPAFHGKGIGSHMITTFLKEVEQEHPEILRVEIIARESNPAIKLYEKMGFKKEGRFEGRIKGVNGTFEADIPMAWINPQYKS